MLYSIADIRKAHETAGGFWFSPDAMRFWGTIVDFVVYPTEAGTYFVSSDWTFDDGRAYSVRFCDLGGDISTVGFQVFGSRNAARQVAKDLAEKVSR